MPGFVDALPEATARFYRQGLAALVDAEVPFLVGGAFALNAYTGIDRYTKDLDVFVRSGHLDAASRALEAAGFEVRREVLHWLSKAHQGEDFIDIIIALGNGIGHVDDGWFAHGRAGMVLEVPVTLAGPEDMIFADSFVMERERYDGAEVAHLLHDSGASLDWPYLVGRYGDHWRVLLSHLVLFGFIYPGRTDIVPGAVMDQLLRRLEEDERHRPQDPRLCRGTLISGKQYLVDVEQRGYNDARPDFARQVPEAD